MKKFAFKFLLWLAAGFIPASIFATELVPAFPGAEGGGAYATGGRGAQVYYITSLDDADSVPGTLRWTLLQKGPKLILFKVAGIINLKSELKITKGNVTIAGQSAPGDGICIKGYPFVISADNVIIRFLRFRMGNVNNVQDDALKANKRKNIIIDHCSMSWSTDECASFYDNENFTLQWSIISESLRNSVHKKGAHGYGGIWGGKKASFHHNLLAHHDSRNPRFCGSRYTNTPELEKVDFRNNVIYNWGSNSGYAGEGGEYNIVHNYYKPGPATLAHGGKMTYRIFAPNSDDGTNNQPAGVWGKFYVKGNVVAGYAKVTKNNTEGFQPNLRAGETTTAAQLLSATEFPFFTFKPQTAQQAYDAVLLHAGASLVRDAVDQRIVREVQTGTYTFTGSNGSKNGIIDTQEDVGGWPAYSYEQKQLVVDSDNDGMPDDWETKNKLNPQDASDGGKYSLCKHYTNVEVYLNSLVDKL
ncbi:MAG: hypothetical protein H6Q20_843 [Bacteroidetes bacterium]|nr:hypothetical protein [Bacteroidota bacterium]